MPNGVQYARKKIRSWPHVSPRRCACEPGTCGRGASYSAKVRQMIVDHRDVAVLDHLIK